MPKRFPRILWMLPLAMMTVKADAQTAAVSKPPTQQTALDGETVGPDGVIVDEETGETTTIIDPTSFPPQPGKAASKSPVRPGLSDYIPAKPMTGGIPAKAMKTVAPVAPVTPSAVTVPTVASPVVSPVNVPAVTAPSVAVPSVPSVAVPVVAPAAPPSEVVDIPSRRVISEPQPQADGSASASGAPPQPSVAPQRKTPMPPRVYDPITGRDITNDNKAGNAPAFGNRFKKVPSIREQAEEGASAPATAPAMRYPIIDAISGRELNKPKDAPPLRTPVFDAISGRELNAPKDAPAYRSPVYSAITGEQLNAAENKKNGIQPYVPIKRDAITGERIDRNALPVAPATAKKESLRDRVRSRLKE